MLNLNYSLVVLGFLLLFLRIKSCIEGGFLRVTSTFKNNKHTNKITYLQLYTLYTTTNTYIHTLCTHPHTHTQTYISHYTLVSIIYPHAIYPCGTVDYPQHCWCPMLLSFRIDIAQLRLNQIECNRRDGFSRSRFPPNSTNCRQNAFEKTESQTSPDVIDNIWIFLISLQSNDWG